MARAAGVSTASVSLVLNDRPGPSEQTRRKVLDAADRLGFVPSARARALSTARAAALGLVIAREPELLALDPFFAPFIAGVESALAPRGHVLVLQVVASDADPRQVYRALVAAGRVDGVLLTDLRVDDARPAVLHEVGLPGVAVGRQRGTPHLPAVVLDDRPGIAAATGHLLELGHRRVDFVGGPRHLVHGDDRHAAWAAAMAAVPGARGTALEADFTAAGGAKATQTLLAQDDRPTAVVYANDVMALAGMSVLASHGLSVPGDVSVTGFDDVELGAHVSPPLTSVRTDVVGWGAHAARLLLDVVEGRPAPDVDLPPARLVLRGSTAQAPSGRDRTTLPHS